MRPPDPSRHLLGGDPPAVVISARVAALLDRLVLDDVRRRNRGADLELDVTLIAVRIAAIKYLEQQRISGGGNAEVPIDLDVSSSARERVGTAQAADVLGITPRQVVNLADVLRGQKVAGRWTFDIDDVNDLRQRRREIA